MSPTGCLLLHDPLIFLSFIKFNHNGVIVVYFRRVEPTCPGSPGDYVVHMVYKISCYTPFLKKFFDL